MNFNNICDSESPKIGLYELLKVLARDIESEAVLQEIVNGAESFEMEERTLVVRMMSGDNLYIYPPTEGKSYPNQPIRYQEMAGAFSGLSYPEKDDLGLHFGAFNVNSEFTEIKRAFAPIQEYDNWYYYNSNNELCYISHEGGSGAPAKHKDLGVTYLYELADALYMDLDKIRRALPFESNIKLVKSKAYLSFDESRDSVPQINISPDGNTFSMAGIQDDVVRLTTKEGEIIKEFVSDSLIFPTAFSPCGSYFAFGSRDRKVTVVDMKTLETKWVFYGEDDRIEPEVLANQITKHTVGESSGHKSWLKSLTFSPDGNSLYSGSNGVIAAHNCTAGTRLFFKVSEKKKRSWVWVTVLEFINEQELLVSNKKVKSIAPATQKTVHKFKLPEKNGVLSGAVSSNKEFVVLSNDKTLLYKNNGEQLRELSNDRAFAIAISSNNSLVALLRDAPCVDIMSMEGELLCRLPLEGKDNSSMSGYSIEFINDTTLLVGYTGGVVELKIEDVV